LLAGSGLGGGLAAEGGEGALELSGHGVKEQGLRLLGVGGDGQGEKQRDGCGSDRKGQRKPGGKWSFGGGRNILRGLGALG